MRTEIDLHVMQEMGVITRAAAPVIEPLSLEISALLETLRSTAQIG